MKRKWDIASIGWTRVHRLLDEGWEPFSVVQREPHTRTTTTEATVYLRRPVNDAPKEET